MKCAKFKTIKACELLLGKFRRQRLIRLYGFYVTTTWLFGRFLGITDGMLQTCPSFEVVSIVAWGQSVRGLFLMGRFKKHIKSLSVTSCSETQGQIVGPTGNWRERRSDGGGGGSGDKGEGMRDVTSPLDAFCFCLVSPSVCRDNNGLCPSWAYRGECSRNPRYMLVNCRLSCKQCRPNPPPTPRPRPPTPRPQPPTTIPRPPTPNPQPPTPRPRPPTPPVPTTAPTRKLSF